MRAGKTALSRSRPRACTKDVQHMLEQRLNLLVHSLNTAEITEKSMDMVKEIKELYAILNAPPDLRAVIQARVSKDVVQGASRAYPGVPRAKDDTAPRPLLVGWSAPAAPCPNNGEQP